jgi:hypothetical protein
LCDATFCRSTVLSPAHPLPPLPYNCNHKIHHIYILIITSALLFSFSFLFAKLHSFSPDLYFLASSSPHSYTTRLAELFFLLDSIFSIFQSHDLLQFFSSISLCSSPPSPDMKKTLQIRQGTALNAALIFSSFVTVDFCVQLNLNNAYTTYLIIHLYEAFLH